MKDILLLAILLSVALLSASSCVTRFDYCTGTYYCLTVTQNNTISINSSCPVWIPQSLVPQPGQCIANGTQCVFYNPCLAWNKTCTPVNYTCTLKSEYEKYISNHTGCTPYRPLPLPEEQCLNINSTCQWYDGCTVWFDACKNSYQCGTIVENYKYTQNSASCPSRTPTSLPRGECIYQSGSCVWSNCRSWLDWCKFNWMCGSQYDYDVYFTTPPPPCPLPPPPPSEPGACRYNLTTNNCQYDYSINPCALIRCPKGTTCKVYGPTGQGYCDPSCDIQNGGCNSTQVCSLEPVQCITAPCPPVVRCNGIDACTDRQCANGTRCALAPGTLSQSTCLPSCFANNGGCDEICTVRITSNCGRDVCTNTLCSKINDYFNGQCTTGKTYSSCGTACPRTCYNHNITIPCIEICVSGCFCPTGLVHYRERCVDPLECPLLLQSPPPLNPLPLPSDSILVRFVATGVSLATFQEHSFTSAVSRIVSNDLTSPTVTLYDVVSNGSSTITIILLIKSNSLKSDKVSKDVINLLNTNKGTLSITVRDISSVSSQYQQNSSTNLNAVIAIVAVIGVVVILLTVVTVVTIVILVYHKHRTQQNTQTEVNTNTYVNLTNEDEVKK